MNTTDSTTSIHIGNDVTLPLMRLLTGNNYNIIQILVDSYLLPIKNIHYVLLQRGHTKSSVQHTDAIWHNKSTKQNQDSRV